jgi:hypothetical protein
MGISSTKGLPLPQNAKENLAKKNAPRPGLPAHLLCVLI